jgi:hypothetical protein
MSDETLSRAQGHDPTLRIYDYFKHLSTVSLIAIGGVLGLIQGGIKMPSLAILVTICVLGVAGIISMMGLNVIATAELKGGLTEKHSKMLSLLQPLANMCLMLGLGIFLGVFMKVIQ